MGDFMFLFLHFGDLGGWALGFCLRFLRRDLTFTNLERVDVRVRVCRLQAAGRGSAALRSCPAGTET